MTRWRIVALLGDHALSEKAKEMQRGGDLLDGAAGESLLTGNDNAAEKFF